MLEPKLTPEQLVFGNVSWPRGSHLVVKVENMLFAVVVQHLAGDGVCDVFLLGGRHLRGRRLRIYHVNRFHLGVRQVLVRFLATENKRQETRMRHKAITDEGGQGVEMSAGADGERGAGGWDRPPSSAL